MGSFTTGIGLISGLNSASIIEQILMSEGRGHASAVTDRDAAGAAERDARHQLETAFVAVGPHGHWAVHRRSANQRTSVPLNVLTAATGDRTAGFMVLHRPPAATGPHTGRSGRRHGLDSFTIDRGDGGLLTSDIEIAALNGGAGIQRGRIELMVGGTTTMVDLRDVVTLDDVLDRLNESGANVIVTMRDQRLHIESTSGDAVSVSGVGDVTTAHDLGLTTDGSSGELIGEPVVTLGESTLLSSLNDGLGVFIRDGAPDLRITTSDGVVHDITIPASAMTLGEVMQAIETGTNGSVETAIAPMVFDCNAAGCGGWRCTGGGDDREQHAGRGRSWIRWRPGWEPRWRVTVCSPGTAMCCCVDSMAAGG